MWPWPLFYFNCLSKNYLCSHKYDEMALSNYTWLYPQKYFLHVYNPQHASPITTNFSSLNPRHPFLHAPIFCGDRLDFSWIPERHLSFFLLSHMLFHLYTQSRRSLTLMNHLTAALTAVNLWWNLQRCFHILHTLCQSQPKAFTMGRTSWRTIVLLFWKRMTIVLMLCHKYILLTFKRTCTVWFVLH